MNIVLMIDNFDLCDHRPQVRSQCLHIIKILINLRQRFLQGHYPFVSVFKSCQGPSSDKRRPQNFGFSDPSPLVRILTRYIVLNPHNLPYYVCFWANPPPPLVRTSFMNGALGQKRQQVSYCPPPRGNPHAIWIYEYMCSISLSVNVRTRHSFSDKGNCEARDWVTTFHLGGFGIIYQIKGSDCR